MEGETKTKGLTVKIDAELHALVREYVESHNMTMAEFVALALDDELHPKVQKGETGMEKTRTIAIQISEDLFQRIKDYLKRNNMTQREFLTWLIEDELNREEQEYESRKEPLSDESEDQEENSTEALPEDSVSTEEEENNSEKPEFETKESETEESEESSEMTMCM